MSEEGAEKAKREFINALENDTCRGEPVASEYLYGAAAGWDAAIAYVKREAFRRLTGL